MSANAMWAIGLLLGVLVLSAMWLRCPPKPDVEVPMPRPQRGPHSIIARGLVDEGYFVVLRTPLYEPPFDAVLFTQVLFDTAGGLTCARCLKVGPMQTGKLIAGRHRGRPVTITVGIGQASADFADAITNWTH